MWQKITDISEIRRIVGNKKILRTSQMFRPEENIGNNIFLYKFNDRYMLSSISEVESPLSLSVGGGSYESLDELLNSANDGQYNIILCL